MMFSMFYPTGKSYTFHEGQYFAKAVRLIFETARGFLFAILLARTETGTVQDIAKILQALKWDDNLEKHVKTCILDSGDELTEGDLDISMIYHVIRKAYILKTEEKPTKGYGKEPGARDMLLGDDIERCRLQRNKLCHSTSASMSENEFKNMEKDMKDIFHRWSNETGMKFVKQVNRIVESSLTIKDVNEIVERFITDVQEAAELGICDKAEETMKNIQAMVRFRQSLIKLLTGYNRTREIARVRL